LGILPSELVILAVGRLSAEKGHADLLAAFALAAARPRRARIRLVVVGDGVEHARLSGLARPLGDRVLFAGHQADTRPWFWIADLFVLPSHSEGSPMALLEAMQSRLAIAATAVGGVPELIENEVSALLVAGHDPPALAAALDRLLEDPALRSRLAEAAFERVRRHPPSQRCAALLRLYREAAGRRESRPA
jgi:glycosyltransferase involved in cell wall biosynthesis